MSGFDILVAAMGVIAIGVGIYCFVTEHLNADKDQTAKTEEQGEKEEA